MRPFLLASLALASFATSTPADACGQRPPRAFEIHTAEARSFVLLNTPVPEGETVRWQMLFPYTYDNTSVAVAPKAEAATTFTLLGDSGAYVVTTNQRVWFEPPFGRSKPTSAIELTGLDSSHPVVAIAGDASDATWMSIIESVYERASAHGLAQGAKLFAISGSRERLLVGWNDEAHEEQTVLLEDDRETSRFHGNVIGGMKRNGARFLFLDQAGAVTTFQI